MHVSSIACTSTPTNLRPMAMPLSDVMVLARTIANCRHELPAAASLTSLPIDRQTELKAVARLLIYPEALSQARIDIELRLRKALAQHVHGTTFERLHEDDRQEIATEAQLVLAVVTRVLAGDVEALPVWERELLLGFENGTE